LVAALAFQAVSLAWTPLPVVGGLVVAERAVALAAALGLAWSLGATVPLIAVLIAAIIPLLDLVTLHTGLWSWLSGDPPFGNPNFNATVVALTVLGVGRWPLAGRAERMATALAVIGALGLLAPSPVGHGTRSVALILGCGAIAWGVLRWLPRRAHGGALGAVAVLMLVSQVVVVLRGVPGLPPSWEQRRHLWSGAVENAANAPLIGHGMGSALAVLPTGPAADRAWLAVPSWPEHAHHELLQTLLEGGGVLLALLAAAVVTLLAPLWRRRDDPAARALLAAWAAALAHAMVESHLLHPGPLGCLALLAAATWTWRPAEDSVPAAEAVPSWWGRLPLIAAAGLAAWVVAGDFTGGGSPPMRDRRSRVALLAAEQRQDWAAAAACVQHLRRQLGPLDDLALIEARLQARLKDYPAATALALEQARRLPVLPGATLEQPGTLDLLRRLAERHAKRGEVAAAAELGAAWDAAALRVRVALAAVPATDKGARARELLNRELAAPPRSAGDLPDPPPATR
jgi:hypothetical protein